MENEKELQVELNSEVTGALQESKPFEGSESASHEEEIESLLEDYSQLTKQELVELAKDLLNRNDFKNIDNVFKELKHSFDSIREKERSDALIRFKEADGMEEDFQFKHDELYHQFENIAKSIREKRNQFFKNQEEQKSDNLKKKLDILERLRTLTDSEDSDQSFQAFKSIQTEWKNSGTVAPAHVKTLWANYTALVDRYYDNRSIYFELKELDRKKNLELKTEICLKAERLLTEEKISDAIRELNELHNEFKHIGAVPREEKESLWVRFKAASDAVYEKRDEFVKKLNAEFQANLEAKAALIDTLESFASFQSDRIKEWNSKTQELVELQKKWESIGQVQRSKAKEINRRFWLGFKSFFNNKNSFFKKLDVEREKNLQLKRELVKRADALKGNLDWEQTANDLKELQQQWKTVGPVPEKFRESVFQEFKKACDYFFENRRQQFDKETQQQEANFLRKKEICSEIEALTESGTGTVDQLKTLQQEFNAVGFVPKEVMVSIRNRFNEAVNKFLKSVGGIENREQVLLEVQINSLKADPQAERKLFQKEQSIKKQISTIENDVAVLRNNLEFFGRSKNADKYKEEFAAKLKEANDQLAQLKSQLKLLKTA